MFIGENSIEMASLFVMEAGVLFSLVKFSGSIVNTVNTPKYSKYISFSEGKKMEYLGEFESQIQAVHLTFFAVCSFVV